MMSCELPDLNEEERTLFWSQVSTNSDVVSCWIWKGRYDEKTGYGKFRINGSDRQAHRIAFSMMRVSPVGGFLVLHSCDERLCVNPRHLRLGTAAENTEDMLIANAMTCINRGELSAVPSGRLALSTGTVKAEPRSALPRRRAAVLAGSDLTARQSEVLGFLVRHVDEKGYPPSIREIADEFGMSSTNGVVDHLNALERKGRIRRDAGIRSRVITIVRLTDSPGPCRRSAPPLPHADRRGHRADPVQVGPISPATQL